MRHAMIMAGGSGTRLWPLSRRERPKQLLPLLPGGRSLLEVALDRTRGVVEPERRWLCTSRAIAEQARASLRLDPPLEESRLLLEPTGRDTLNAVGLAAAVIGREDPEAVITILTADHLIEPADRFRAVLARGFDLVEADPRWLVTYAVEPTHPATGFGYIERGEPAAPDVVPEAAVVVRYVEKPDRPTAERFLVSGRFGWSSGMFTVHARTMMEAIARLAPENHAGLVRIAEAWDTADRDRVLAETWPTLPKTSIDYGVMQPAAEDQTLRVATLPLDIAWLDVGSWPAVGETIDPADEGENRTNVDDEQAEFVDSARVLAVSEDPHHRFVVIGAQDLVIVHTADATLVCRADRAQDVKAILERLPEHLR